MCAVIPLCLSQDSTCFSQHWGNRSSPPTVLQIGGKQCAFRAGLGKQQKLIRFWSLIKNIPTTRLSRLDKSRLTEETHSLVPVRPSQKSSYNSSQSTCSVFTYIHTVFVHVHYKWLTSSTWLMGAVWSRQGHDIQSSASLSVSLASQNDQKTKTHLLLPLGVHPSQQDHQDLLNPAETPVHHSAAQHRLVLCCHFKWHSNQLIGFNMRNYTQLMHLLITFLDKDKGCVLMLVCVCLLDTYINPWKSWKAWFSWYPRYSIFSFETLHRQRFMQWWMRREISTFSSLQKQNKQKTFI